MTRITKSYLEAKVERVNKELAKRGQPELALDFNSIYGGYQLDYAATDNHVTARMPGSMMNEFLSGMDAALWMVK